jgi:predicted lipid-binding transport protein (Tim44 family)/DNA-directed RNA polymerase subunit RPC12/RpoP
VRLRDRFRASPRLARLLGLVPLVLLLAPALAVARPGGGESYSGGGDSGGGGGDGAAGCIWLLVRLWIEFVIRYPLVGIPLTILMVIAFLRWKTKNPQAAKQIWDSVNQNRPSQATRPPTLPRSQDLDAIRTADPDFSAVLFEDFAYALYARAHEARSDSKDMETLTPYLSEAARAEIARRPPAGAPVRGVVIGAMRVVGLSVPPAPAPAGARIEVDLEIEANMTVGAPGSDRTHYVVERWHLVRDAAVRTKAVPDLSSVHCPNCGAPFEPDTQGRCQYCGQVVSGGRFDWSVESISLLRLEERPPALTGTVEEVGTNWPTVFHPAVQARRAELLRDDPQATDVALNARLRVIYTALNDAWTRLDLKAARPYLSDNLFDYLRYWTDAYRSQGLRNVLTGMHVVETVIAKVVRDRHYDAVTFRVWASGRDSTVREATGDVVAGDPNRDRPYSEYWTLIRGAGVRGAPRTEPNCPNCGASLDQINMAGECEHCGAKITRGGFDWVLSKIEQDDSYSG